MRNFGIALLVVGLIGSTSACSRVSKTYTLSEKGGNYLLELHYKKRYLKPITAEGPFPIETGSYQITLLGKGENWSYKNGEGFYYTESEMASNRKGWDIASAWMDYDRRHLYVQAYWFIPPDKLVASPVSGKYQVSSNTSLPVK